MATKVPGDLTERIEELQARLVEAEETLRALREGEVDAIVASGPDGDRVYTLKGADEAYRIIVEEMGEGAITVTADGLILFANAHFASMVHRPMERVIGSRLGDFVVPADAGLVSALLNSNGRRKAEVRLTRDGAGSIPAYLAIQNMSLLGNLCRCIIVTDLSDQKHYAEITAILDAVPAAVFIARDAACRSVVGNRMAYELLRLPSTGSLSKSAPEIREPKTWREVRDGREIPAADLPLQTAARTGRSVHDSEVDLLFDDGAYRCWLGNAVPVFDETGQPSGAVGAFIDITQRRQTAEALETANAELRNFANALTQDLREPLSMLVNLTRVLAQQSRGKLGEETDALISDALEGSVRIEGLLNALLEYWSVTTQTVVDLTPVDCNVVLSRTLQSLHSAIENSGATVTSGPLPTVAAEEPMLERLFLTLIGNAIQYRSEVAPRIHLSAENTVDRWLFSVRDNGIGIEPKNAERVFGLFQRLHGNEIPGTGIGLALCKKIVERHGGRIWVEPAPGGGAAFRFTLPSLLGPTLPGLAP